MLEENLGRLERIDLRDIWINEAAQFTPWLARTENIALLAESLGMDLEVEAQEKSVGGFRADILCKDRLTDHWVLIENQLEWTDHRHLGQLLTYASGLDAVTIVWIAAKFREEHRSTLDWLNKITENRCRFFGLEVELWRIGNSSAAPKFNIVSQPNDFSQSVAAAARAIDEVELSETRSMQREYWEALNKMLEQRGGPVAGNKKPQPQGSMSFPIGRNGFYLGGTMIRPKQQIRAELYISTAMAKTYFSTLKGQQKDIEGELGFPLNWEELPERRDCRIAAYLDEADPEQRADWLRQHGWLADHLNHMHRVFSSRVMTLGDGSSRGSGILDDETSNGLSAP